MNTTFSITSGDFSHIIKILTQLQPAYCTYDCMFMWPTNNQAVIIKVKNHEKQSVCLNEVHVVHRIFSGILCVAYPVRFNDNYYRRPSETLLNTHPNEHLSHSSLKSLPSRKSRRQNDVAVKQPELIYMHWLLHQTSGKDKVSLIRISRCEIILQSEIPRD